MVKIQRKNRKKVKPLHSSEHSSADKDSKLNAVPSNDDQWVPRSVREMLTASRELKTKGTFPRKTKKKTVDDALVQVGIERKPRESLKRAIGRMHDKLNKEIREIQLKAKVGMAGRDAKEVAKEYKEMDEGERNKRKMKLLMRKADEEKRFGEARDKTMKRIKAIEDEEERGKMKKKKRETRKDREKKKNREEREALEKETVLNAREVISFGERYDCPPSFKGILKNEMDPLMSKAGSKKLLLHGLLKSDAKREDGGREEEKEKRTGGVKKEKMSKLMEMERLRVIEAYRNMKKGKNINRDAPPCL